MNETLEPHKRVREKVDEIERRADDLRDELTRLEREVEDLRREYPSVRGVMEVEVAGVMWFTDGWRCIRDVWPGDYEYRESKPDIGALLEKWEAVTVPVAVVEFAEHSYQGAVALLHNGAWLNRHWMHELTLGRGWTMHHGGDPKAIVVFRDAAGKVAGGQMPLTVSEDMLSNRRPAASPEESAEAGK